MSKKLSSECNGCTAGGLDGWMHEQKWVWLWWELVPVTENHSDSVVALWLEQWWKMLSTSGGLVWPLSAIPYFLFCPSGRRQRPVRIRASAFHHITCFKPIWVLGLHKWQLELIVCITIRCETTKGTFLLQRRNKILNCVEVCTCKSSQFSLWNNSISWILVL